MPRRAGVDGLIIGVRDRHERDGARLQRFDARVNVLSGKGYVLDAFAVISLKIFGDLRFVVGALVDRNANPPVRASHSLRAQPGQLALDVEVADLAEIEQALVEFGPQL